MNVGIVGCGSIAQVHSKCLSNISMVNLIGFCDTQVDKAKSLCELYGGKSYLSYEEMLVNEEIDVVHICTPHYLHVPMALLARKYNKHVFMEKPPVMTKEELKELEESWSMDKETYLGFCFQNRYNPSVIAIKDLLRKKETGVILGVRGLVTWARHDSYYQGSDWRGRLALEGGGALINQSIHTLDLMNYLVEDEIEMLDSVMTNHHLKGVIEVEDTMSIYLKYKTCTGTFFATNCYAASVPPLIELECENLRIRMEELSVTSYYKDGKVEELEIPRKIGYGKSYWGSGHEDCIEDFYDCLIHKKRFCQDLDGVRTCIKLMLDAYESAREGHPIYYGIE